MFSSFWLVFRRVSDAAAKSSKPFSLTDVHLVEHVVVRRAQHFLMMLSQRCASCDHDPITILIVVLHLGKCDDSFSSLFQII